MEQTTGLEEYSCELSLDVWSDNNAKKVLGYFQHIINKFPKDMVMVEPSDLFVGNEDNPYGDSVDMPNFSLNKTIKKDGKIHYTAIYWVSGKYTNRQLFIDDLQMSINICNKNGVATIPIEYIKINKITGD